jgi:hypothetical protein
LLCAAVLALVCATTAFAQVPAPYNTDFELEIQCGTAQTSLCPLLTPGWLNLQNGVADDIDWLSDVGGTSSSLTGPSGPGGTTTGGTDSVPGTTTGHYLYTETSGTAFRTARLRSPLFDLTGVASPLVSWDYHMFGATMGTMHLDIIEVMNGVAAADGVISGTMTFDSATANFTAAHVGTQIVISNSGLGSNGTYNITSINSATSVELDVAPIGGPEAGLAYTHQNTSVDVITPLGGMDLGNTWFTKLASLAGVSFVGNGSVNAFYAIIRGQTGSSFTSDMAVDNFSYLDAPLIDVGVNSIDSIPAGATCGGAMWPVTVTIENFGSTTETNIPLTMTVDTVPQVTETYTGTLLPGATDTFTFILAMADLTGPGAHTVDVTSMLGTDINPGNDTASVSTATLAVASLPYFEDFEGGDGGWAAGGNGTWAFGTPAGTVINTAASGINAWCTGNLTGIYNNSEASYVLGPCLDLSTAFNPFLTLSVNWYSEFSWDGAQVQTSIDGGASWQQVGAFGDPSNWYNDGTVVGISNAGFIGAAGGEGWSGNGATGSAGWLTASHLLDGLAGQSQVIIRIFFGSDGSVNSPYQGFAFDDISVTDAGAPPYPGTNGDMLMATGVNGPVTFGVGNYIKSTTGGDILTATASSPFGTYDGALLLVGIETFPTAGSPATPFPFPGIHLSPTALFITQINPYFLSVVVPGGNTFSFLVPMGVPGNSILIQGVAVSGLATFGYESTDAYVWDII